MPDRLHNDSIDFVHRLTLDSNDSDGEDLFDSASPCKPLRGSQILRHQHPVLNDASAKINRLASYSLSASLKKADHNSPLRSHTLQPIRPRPALQSVYPSPLQSPTDPVESSSSLASLATSVSITSELDSDLGSEVDTDGDIEADVDSTLLDPLEPEDEDIGANHKGAEATATQLHQHFSDAFKARHRQESITEEEYPMYHRPNRSVLGIPLSQHHRLGQSTDNEGHLEDEANASPGGVQSGIFGSVAPRSASMRKDVWMPRTKVRRTQSMFATPEQMLHEQLLGNMDRTFIGDSQGPSLSLLDDPDSPIETFAVRQDPFLRVTHDTLCKLIDGEYRHLYSDVLVIDCRFEYEYEGGHIDGAINVNSKQQLEQTLFQKELCNSPGKKLLVFHCEYSAYRSPMLASHLRYCDRSINAAQYPNLYYPDVVVLHGGYKQFYTAAAHRCIPQNYVGMNHQAHQSTCEREMSKFRNGMKARKFRSMGMASTPHLTEFKFPAPEIMALRSASVSDLSETSSSLHMAQTGPREPVQFKGNLFGL